jgi:hypothetical protein
MAGKTGAKAGGVPIQQMTYNRRQRGTAQPPLGAGLWPLSAALPKGPTLWAGIFTLLYRALSFFSVFYGLFCMFLQCVLPFFSVI